MMNASATKHIALLMAALLCSGCSTMQQLRPADVHVGDTITCTMHTGATKTFQVSKIESGWIIGESNGVYAADVEKIEKPHPLAYIAADSIGWIAIGVSGVRGPSFRFSSPR